MKFLIHPSIPFNKTNLRIADFATGTGIWLIDVSKIVQADCKLDGFDLSSAQFPPRSEWPPNVSLHTHDILKPLPMQYHGSYDIIAVRAVLTVLTIDEWAIAVSNLVNLLSESLRNVTLDFHRALIWLPHMLTILL
jgi:SAM-dependent methyltransferase